MSAVRNFREEVDAVTDAEHDAAWGGGEFADEHQRAVWEAKRVSDHGEPWGTGRSEAEILAEVERQVAEWVAERAERAGLSVAEWETEIERQTAAWKAERAAKRERVARR